jgi:drug/metabolite transporter (DMT)-like permease
MSVTSREICPEECLRRVHCIGKMATIGSQRYIPAMESSDISISRATLLIVVSALSFGSISVLTVLVTRGGLPLLTAMAWRYVIGAVILFAIVGVKQLGSLPKQRLIQLCLIGGFGQALITYLSLHALDYIPVGPLAFLFYTYPAWVALVAAVRRTEKLTSVRMIALTLALVGVTVMVGAPSTDKLNPTGVILALGSALLYSVYLPSLEHIQQGLPALVSTFMLVTGAAVTFVIAALFASELYLPTGLLVWSDIVVLALVSTVIAFSALIKGLSVLGPVRTAIIATVEPFFTAMLGIAVLGNQLTMSTLLGGILIAAAVLLIQWSSARLEAIATQRGADGALPR